MRAFNFKATIVIVFGLSAAIAFMHTLVYFSIDPHGLSAQMPSGDLGITQIAAACSSVTVIEQCLPTGSGRAARTERASLIASICAAVLSVKLCTPWSETM